MAINRIFYILLIPFSTLILIETSGSNYADTIFNQTDNNGVRQGHWKAHYENGTIRYEGFFKDGKPLGLFQRYNADGTLAAKLEHDPDGKTVYAKLYYPTGNLAAEGKFVNENKDSTWNYYSYYTNTLSTIENYKHGKRHGVTKKYHNNGGILEEITFNEGLKNGSWKQYYENGSLMLDATFKNDLRNGKFIVYHMNGKVQTSGTFVNNFMHDKWSYFDEEGYLEMEIIYENGNPQNQELLDEQSHEFFRMIEQNKGRIPEPDESDFIPGLR